MHKRIGIILLVLAASGGAAAAEPVSTRCYAGKETGTVLGTARTEHVILRRTLDPAKSELRETVWHDERKGDAAAGKDMVAAIDVKAGTFTTELDGQKATGTLTGPAWHWTEQTTRFVSKGVTLAITSKLEGDHAHMTGHGTKDGKDIVTIAAELDVIDCGKVPAPAK